MSTLVGVVGGLFAGAAGALVFFGGLAATVRRVPDTRRPAALVVVSLVVRTGLLAVVLAALALLGAAPLLAGAAAFVGVRVALLRRVRAAGASGGDDRWT